MPDSFLAFCHAVFVVLFVITLVTGAYLFVHFERLFGRDPNIPSENSSARSYSRMQVFSVWAHALVLFGAFALLVH